MNRTTAAAAFALLAAQGLSATSVAIASTDMDKFAKRLAKSAVTDERKPAVLCVCKDGSQNQNRAGVLEQLPQGAPNSKLVFVVNCYALQFDSTTGALEVASGCATWELLPK